MSTVKSDITDNPVPPTTSSASQAFEWEQFDFTFDMDQGKSSNLNSRRPRSASTPNIIYNHGAREQHTGGSGVSAQEAALLAQSASVGGNFDQAYSSMSRQGYYPSMAPSPGFYGNFLHHDNMPPPQSVPSTLTNFPWEIPAPPPHSKSSTTQYNVPQASSSTSLHPGLLAFLDSWRSLLQPSDATTSNPQQPRVSTVASHKSSSPEMQLTETERAGTSDEKRRRNTAASARFRIKKKHKTIALERTVSDLTSRAEELEREVGDLRRENGWLKEIVMLKGTQNVASNRLALRQAVDLATSQRTYGSQSALHIEDASEGPSPLSDDETPVKKPKDNEGPKSIKFW
ncbi:hypothetical protein BYT27DRAFT_7189376 [Phlegmacium glaucopus]|nr:hypothetical protein BYT27DRAFT_7189376 [Phlegmacium glaucopus]